MASIKDTTSLGTSVLIAQRASASTMMPKAPKSLPVIGALSPEAETFWEIATPISVGLSAYHGYKRNNGSIGWALGWGLLGGIFPVITPAIAVAEGFGKPK